MSPRSRRSSGQRPAGRRPKDLKRPAPTDASRRASSRAVPRSAVGRSRVTAGSAGGGFDPRILLGAGAILVIAVGAYVLTGGFGGSGAGASASAGGTPYAPVARASNPPGCPTAQPSPEPSGQTPTVTINTSKGAIVIKADGSPIATGNFVTLAQCGFYNGLVFHRLVPGFVIQGGDPNGDGTGGPGYTIADEVVTGTYKAGTVAMARTQQPNSQGSQFFIVLADSAASTLSQANPGYAIVGEVTSGMDVVNAIAAMPNSGSPDNAALQPVTMTSVTVSP